MCVLTSSWSALMADPQARMETLIIVGFVAFATVGFLAGLREMASDLRRFRRAKV